MRIVVEKYHGLGNDYLVYDPNKNKLKLTPSNVQLMCNRNFGVGADGILEGPVLDGEQISMVVWNPDGSVAQKSGNGVRIFAKYLKDAGYVQKKDFTISSQGGEASIHYLNEEGTRLKASMGKVSFWSDDVPVEGPRRKSSTRPWCLAGFPIRLPACPSAIPTALSLWMRFQRIWYAGLEGILRAPGSSRRKSTPKS